MRQMLTQEKIQENAAKFKVQMAKFIDFSEGKALMLDKMCIRDRRYPERIAVVTSSAGAAVHDSIRVLRKRWPVAKVVLLPVRVQGVEAPPERCV